MIVPNETVLWVMNWIADRLGLDIGLEEDGIIQSLDEREVTEQLQYGRD